MKKEYIEPQIEVLTMTTLQMLAFSGNDSGEDDIIIDPVPDVNSGINNSWILSGDPMNFFTNQ
jgi:hypothetical protein